jgi:hypothetical protein
VLARQGFMVPVAEAYRGVLARYAPRRSFWERVHERMLAD